MARVIPLFLLCGCVTFSVAARDAGANHSELPADLQNPHAYPRWAFFWGLAGKNHVSVEPDPCVGQGIARVELSRPLYAVPLEVVTLGIVQTATVTFYCSTEPRPACGPPQGP